VTTFKASDMMAWPYPRTRAEFETALAGGRLYARMAHRRFWLVRREGPTLVRPDGTWYTPIRAGFTVYGEACQRTLTVYRVRPLHVRAKAQIRPV
jgi:hypothetical protein